MNKFRNRRLPKLIPIAILPGTDGDPRFSKILEPFIARSTRATANVGW